MKKIPRGIRNNNPLNIRIGNDWCGEVQKNTDGVFEQFNIMEDGIRAACIILFKYIDKYKRNTIEKIIRSWAPESDGNQPKAYIEFVSLKTGIPRNEIIRFRDKKRICDIISAMILVENGCAIDREIIERGYIIAANHKNISI